MTLSTLALCRPHAAPGPSLGDVLGVALAVVAVLFVVLIGVFAVWVTRRTKQLEKERNARLSAFSQSLGLTVRPETDSGLFFAEGTARGGVPLRISVERVVHHGGSDGPTTATLFSVAAKCPRPLPALVVRDRREPNRGDVSPTLHQISTGNEMFDSHFVTWADDDAAAKNVLDRGARDLLLGLGALKPGSTDHDLWMGVDSFSTGGEVALATQVKLSTHFFAAGRPEKVIEAILRLAGGP